METIKQRFIPYEYGGKTYQLTCNFNVLADLTEYFKGKIPDLSKGTNLKFFKAMLAFAMNDYADTQGWEERFTPTEIGRSIDTQLLIKGEYQELMTDVIKLFLDACYTKSEETEEPKN